MRRRSTIKVLFFALALLLAGAATLIIIAINQYNNIKSDPMKIFQQANSQATAEPQPTPSNSQQTNSSPVITQQQELKRITVDSMEYIEKPQMLSILFCGGDYMASRAGRVAGERSDMIMVCAINGSEKKATLISIPRDTRALVAKVDQNSGKVMEEQYDKINSAFAYGGGPDRYSYQNTMRCVETFLNTEGTFGISIRHYTGLNVDGIPHIADALGGVTLKLTEDFPGIGQKGETVTLKGQKAIDFVRERHAFASSDLARTQHQQAFMIALAKKVQKMGAAESIIRLYNEVTKYVNTNLITDEMVALSIILDKIDVDSIEHFTIPGEWREPFIWPDVDKMKEIMLKTYYNPA